jgi:hypothetical protein
MSIEAFFEPRTTVLLHGLLRFADPVIVRQCGPLELLI